MAKANLTAQRVREVLHYDPETGCFTWAVRTSNRVKVGDRVGNESHGRIQTSIDGVRCELHRLAWLYMTREWPKHDIDHINGNPSDNRFANLRDVPHRMNIENQGQKPRTSASGLIGAHWSARHKLFESKIKSRGMAVHLGWFKTAQEAHQVYVAAKRRLHEGCTL